MVSGHKYASFIPKKWHAIQMFENQNGIKLCHFCDLINLQCFEKNYAWQLL